MADIIEMKMPSPGESITEVEVAQLLVQNGDVVELDQPIAEIDSDKATLELNAEVAGKIEFLVEEGIPTLYEDDNGEEVEETLHGMSARIFMHENEHMNGYVFTDLVSKLKLERAEKSKQKMIKEIKRRQGAPKIIK